MKKTGILIPVMLFCYAHGELIESALMSLNGPSIALWGDRHTPYGSDIDKQQLSALKNTLRNRNGSRPLHLIVEKTSSITKLQNLMNKHILTDAQNVNHKYPYYKPLSTENIEMRGTALAAAYILNQPKQTQSDNWHYLDFEYDDAHGRYPLKNITIQSLRQAYHLLRTQCLSVIRNNTDRFGRPLWHNKIEEADAGFHRVERMLRIQTNDLVQKKYANDKRRKRVHKVLARNNLNIDCLKNKTDQQTAQLLASSIIDAFSALFDIILADRVLSLTNNGYDVAVCAGAMHTRTIMGMINAAHPEARTLFQRQQSLDNGEPLTYQDINVFERSKSWWQTTWVYKWCVSWIPEMSFCDA